jgi:putative intracellular protease/amidase
MKHWIFSAAMVILPATSFAGEAPAKPVLHDGMIKVAIVISPHVNVMDIAGPWEVFADTSLTDDHGKDVSPYELYTVSASTSPVKSEGSANHGLAITPDYDFAHAPKPDIVVVPAQSGSPELVAWLKQVHAQNITIMSVCTGAFQLAKAGLLDGKSATTHHWFFGDFTHDYPDVKLVKDVRYVQADPVTFTAGGLTSGVDLALHLVADRFGQDVAQQTADFMEYLGTGWKTNQGISALAAPVKHYDWIGQLGADTRVVLHQTVYGASPVFTLDIPSQQISKAPATITQKGKHVDFAIAIPGHPARFTGQVADGDTAVSGNFVQDGKTYPLTLTQAQIKD